MNYSYLLWHAVSILYSLSLAAVAFSPPLWNPSSSGSFSSWSTTASSALYQSSDPPDAENANLRPIPAMPSDLFQQLALSQLELLANSLRNRKTSKRKIESMALYLPQENGQTGQLEFLPAVIYPHPSMERIFIASDADSGLAPTLPKLLTKLPGFAAPHSLLPRYPMVSSVGEAAGVGVVEEVLCDVQSRAAALSVPLFRGSQTVGVLLVSPAVVSKKRKKKQQAEKNGGSVWSAEDKDQIARAARTLSMALSMDTDRSSLQRQNQQVQTALSDSLHQVKNPLQALRTFGKLLQQRVAEQNHQSSTSTTSPTVQLLDLTQNLMVQSDRVVSLLEPMDSLVESLDNGGERQNNKPPLYYLNPAPEPQPLVPWDQAHPPNLPWETDTLEFARKKEIPTTKKKRATNREQGKEDSTIEFSGKQGPPKRKEIPKTTTSGKKALVKRKPNGKDSTIEKISRDQRPPKKPATRSSTPTREPTLNFERRQAIGGKSMQQSKPQKSSTSKTPRSLIGGEEEEEDKFGSKGGKDGQDSTMEFSRKPRQPKSKPGSSSTPSDLTIQFERRQDKVPSSPPPKSTASKIPSLVGDDDDLEMGFLVDVLEPTFSMYKALATEQGVSFQILGLDQADELPGVLLRRKALQEAVSNLLDNAFKYVKLSSNQNPMVRVRLLANEEEEDDSQEPGVTLIVEDNGIGIPVGETEAVFERGFRSPSIRDLAPGTGIGLDISRSLLEQMGGKLECFNENSVDSRFTPKLLEGAVFSVVLFRKQLS